MLQVGNLFGLKNSFDKSNISHDFFSSHINSVSPIVGEKIKTKCLTNDPVGREDFLMALHRDIMSMSEMSRVPDVNFLSFEYQSKKFFLVYLLGDYIPESIVKSGVFYEIDFLRMLKKLYLHNGVVIDCGANIGNHTLYFAGIMSSRVIAFEPQPINFRILEKNIEINSLKKLVFIRNLALSDKKGNIDIAMAVENNYGTFTSDISYVEKSRGVSSFEKFNVTVSTLDDELRDLNRSVSILKIDVEGMEMSVLKGAVNTIKKYLPIISVESFDKKNIVEIKKFLKCFGYFIYEVVNFTPTFIFLTKYNQDHLALVESLAEEKVFKSLSGKKGFGLS
jgi:FkbM family methyltransferase